MRRDGVVHALLHVVGRARSVDGDDFAALRMRALPGGFRELIEGRGDAIVEAAVSAFESIGLADYQARVVLQVHVRDTADDVDTAVYLDSPSAGSYEVSANLYDHRAVSRGDLLPQTVGEQASVSLLVRVILLAVSDGAIQAETYVEDTATLGLTKDGLSLSVGGNGSVSVEQ